MTLPFDSASFSESISNLNLSLLLFYSKTNEFISTKQFRTIWGNESIIQAKQFEQLKQIFGAAHNRHPHRHPVLEHILDHAMAMENDFQKFWWVVIEEHLAKQHWEKKYIAIDCISYAFEHAQERHIPIFLQGETVKLIRNALSDFGNPSRDFLGKKSQQFCISVANRVSSCDEKLQKVILMAFFKFFARIKPVVRSILKVLSPSVLDWLMEWWQQFWIKGIDTQFGLKMGEVLQSRRWLLDIISSIINVRQPNGESKTNQSETETSTSTEIVEIWAKPLRLLITSSLFVVPEKLSKKCKIQELKQILELAEIEDEQLSDINNQIQNLINVNRNAYLKYAFEFAKECALQKGVQLRNPFEDVAQVSFKKSHYLYGNS